MIDPKKLDTLREALQELDDLEAPTRAKIDTIEGQMSALKLRWDSACRELNSIGDRWADRLDETLPGWRALLVVENKEPK